MIISPLNSIRFKRVNSYAPSFDNTLVADERFYNDSIFEYCQRFPLSTHTVQIKSDSATVPTVIATKANKSTETITASLVSSYDTDSDGSIDTYFFEFDVDMTLFTTLTYIRVTQGSEVMRSEPFIGEDLSTELAKGEVLKTEYYNEKR